MIPLAIGDTMTRTKMSKHSSQPLSQQYNEDRARNNFGNWILLVPVFCVPLIRLTES